MKRRIWYLALLMAVWGLYGFLLSGWWYSDDPEIIAFAAGHSPSEFLFKPHTWQSFSPFNLVPWILMSLKIDVMLADFTPYFYYLHQLMALSVVAMALFAVLNLYVERKFLSFAGVLIFLLHPATLGVVSWISTRQYLEGLGFALFGIYFYLTGLHSRKFQLIYISTLFYAFAVISKEIYVPLPLLLILLPRTTAGQGLPEAGLKTRIQNALPLFIMGGLYMIYRAWMLGDNAAGGYSSIWPWTVKSAALSTPEVFKAYSRTAWVYAVISPVLIWRIREIRGWKRRGAEMARAVSIFALFYLPIMPVSPLWGGLLSLRYFFLTSLFVTLCYLLCLDSIFKNGGRLTHACLISSLLFVVAVFSYNFHDQKLLWNSEKAQAYAEGKFFIQNRTRPDVVFKIGQPHWFFDGLEKMESLESRDKEDRKIRLVTNEFYGFQNERKEGVFTPLRVFAYDRPGGAVIDITAAAVRTHEAFLKNVKDRPLEVDISMKKGILNLQLGPYGGQYFILEASPEQTDFYYMAVKINRKFSIKLTHREKVRVFCFAYTSPEGWTTVSPGFLVDRSKDQSIRWARRDD